ncbi:MAG: ATP synthase subunit I [Peptococcaceae bacterium]|nr:ATP synthase subunit I [Peptococcaceae bacterium]
MKGFQPVPELDNRLRQVLIISGFFLAGIALALFIYPGDGLLWGMAVGTAAGMYNAMTLAGRIKRLTDLSPDKARKHMNMGLAFRLGLIMAVLALVSFRLPFVSIPGVGAGLLMPTCVSVVLSIVDTCREYRRYAAMTKKLYGK